METADLVNRLEVRVETHLDEAIRVLQNLDEHVLLKPAPGGGWSIAQCLWHLNSYGDFYLPRIGKALARPGRQRKFKSGWLGAYFVRMMEPFATGRKYKAFSGHVPPQSIDAHTEVAKFIRQQEILLGYLGRALAADLNKRIPISVSKWITLKLGDVLQFLIAHNERHLLQAKKSYRSGSI